MKLSLNTAEEADFHFSNGVFTLESCSTSINFPIFSLLISFAVAMSPASQMIKPKSTPTTFLKLSASAINQAEIFFVSLPFVAVALVTCASLANASL